MFERISVPSLTIAADVSSQLVSIPSTFTKPGLPDRPAIRAVGAYLKAHEPATPPDDVRAEGEYEAR